MKRQPKSSSRSSKRLNRRSTDDSIQGGFVKNKHSASAYATKHPSPGVVVEAKTEKQAFMLASINSGTTITIGVGPAGTGKTAIATRNACKMLQQGRISEIILTRPIVEIGNTIGHLPGTIEEKYAPYLVPFIDQLNACFGSQAVENMIKNGKIKPVAMNFIQGRTFNKAMILLDEAQNCTPQDMFMTLTRLGTGSQIVITGDRRQAATSKLLKENGLIDFLDKVDSETNGVNFNDDDICVVEFTHADNVRSGISKKITMLYS